MNFDWTQATNYGVGAVFSAAFIATLLKIASKLADAKIRAEQVRAERDAARDAAYVTLHRESAERFERMHNGTMSVVAEASKQQSTLSDSMDNLATVVRDNTHAFEKLRSQIEVDRRQNDVPVAVNRRKKTP